MTGRLLIVGIGPGNPDQMTPEAAGAVAEATDLYGYKPYLDRLALGPGQTAHRSDNREELDRAGAALEAACAGRVACVVSGGDAGVFAMAAAVCEAVENGPDAWREVDIAVVPGITAMLAVAARVGAPLGHDFCAISLSDNLKPWELIESRLRAVAGAGLVVAIYNPVSRARPWQLDRAFDLLREVLPGSVPVVFGRAAGRPDEKISVVQLSQASASMADMATCVIVGSAETRSVARPGRPALVYAPRSSLSASAR